MCIRDRGKIRVRGAERRRCNVREGRFKDDRRSAGGLHARRIFSIREKGEIAGFGFVNAGDALDVDVRVALKLTPQLLCDESKFQELPPRRACIQWYTFPLMSEHRSVLKSTSTISALTVVSRIFGYIRDKRISFLLGTGDLADAYSIAFRIPNTLRRLVGEGAVSAAFIPVFSQYLAEGKRKETWEFVNTILSAAIVVMSLVVVLGILGSSFIMAFFAGGFGPEKLHSATILNRIIFPYIGLVSLSAIAMGVLNSHGRFGASAFAPVCLNISIIALSFMSDFFPNPAIALSVGVVIGGVLQILVQVPSLVRTGWRLRWLWNLSQPGVKRVAGLIGPRLFGMGIVQIDVLVGTQFASHMIEGSVASLGLADRVMELVLGGYAIALSTAVLPLLARQAAANRMEDMKGTLTFATRLI